MSASPDRFQNRVYVVDRSGEICLRISAVEAAAWCTDGHAKRLSRERIKLTGAMQFHPCRTRTGRSYTYQEPTQCAVDQLRYGPIPIQPSGRTVLAHKTIASEDRCYFRAAVLDNFVDLTK